VRDNQVCLRRQAAGSPQQGVKFDPSRGAPIHCTSAGKIYMSRLPARARDKLVRALPLTAYIDTTVTDATALLRILRETRDRGWAKNNEEFLKGVVARHSSASAIICPPSRQPYSSERASQSSTQ